MIKKSDKSPCCHGLKSLIINKKIKRYNYKYVLFITNIYCEKSERGVV